MELTKLNEINLEDAITHLKSTDEIMKVLIQEIGPLSLKRAQGHPFPLIRMILSQQISSKAADTIIGRFESVYNNDTDKISAATIEQLREVGISRQKAGYVKSIIEHFQMYPQFWADPSAHSVESVKETLIKIKGVGNWTIDIFSMFCLGYLDIFPEADLGISGAMLKFYGARDKESRDQIRLIWSPYQTVACMYLWRGLDNGINV